MVNIFSLFLVLSTLITGILWCLNKFVYKLKFHKYQKSLYIIASDRLNKKILKKIKLKSFWIENGASIFPMLSIVLVIRSFIYEPFQIPSGSMMPTLLVGDFILVEKFTYGIKDPIFQKTLIKTGHPRRGDIVVFKYPENPRLDYIKRIIGLPGDKVVYDIKTKKITIQSRYNSDNSRKNTIPVTYSNIGLDHLPQELLHCKNKKLYDIRVNENFLKVPNTDNEKNVTCLSESKETIENVTHHILTFPIAQDQIEMYYQQPGQKQATWIVPSGQYFMMGDNRDNSSDSRYWGFVPEENMIGKATAIWMSFKKKEGGWINDIRLNRIGKIY